jgi:hypothetical protein
LVVQIAMPKVTTWRTADESNAMLAKAEGWLSADRASPIMETTHLTLRESEKSCPEFQIDWSQDKISIATVKNK